MKNPLNKRFLRELKSDFGKYLVIFLFLLLSISEISGYSVAAESMIAAYNESFEKYRIEDGNFTTEEKMKPRQIRAAEELGITVYELFFADRKMDTGATMRVFRQRGEVDLACLMNGRFPESKDEIAIDRMFADNNGYHTGDRITIEGTGFTISGLAAMSDYSALFESNSDMMFDSKMFCVGMVTEEAFSAIPEEEITPRYAWIYNDPPKDEHEEQERGEALAAKLNRITKLTGFVPRFMNQAIRFTGNDMTGDNASMTMFLVFVTATIAFVFAVTISNTIMNEAGVIGTLRAMGYTRGEMLRHFMTLPVLVTLAAAVVGNVLGYTVFKDINARLYYGSYSLPTYVTRWSSSAFIKTTLIPVVLMLVINLGVLHSKLKLSPLKFLRRDLGKRKAERAVRLNRRLPFFSRFRLRILFQNISNYVLLVFGILFANILLLFGLMFPDVLGNYQDSIGENMLANYQYILQLPAGAVDEDNKISSLLEMLYFQSEVETENETAEKFSAYSLKTLPDPMIHEDEILLYGLEENSRFLSIPFADDGSVWISSGFAEKDRLSVGDTFSLKEAYEETEYTFKVGGIWHCDSSLCVFMPMKDLNVLFDLGEDTFSGYFSDTEITDISPKYISQTIDREALTKVSRQLTISMGGMMKVVDIFAILMFMILIYLMSKIIIEKNAQSISLSKILGYSNPEIARLYLAVTTIFVIAVLIASIPVSSILIQAVFAVAIRMKMSGWIPFSISRSVYYTMAAAGIVTYIVIAFFEYKRIRRIPMTEALKNVE